MTLIKRVHCVQILLSGFCLLLLLHLLYSYIDLKTTNSTLLNRFSIRKYRKYARTSNITDADYVPSNIFTKQLLTNSSVMLMSNYNLSNDGATSKDPTLTKSLKKFASLNNTLSQDIEVNSSKKSECKDPLYEEGGPITPNITLESLDVVEAMLAPHLKQGGYFEPKDCIPKYHVAIIVPFRDRYAHLSIFLRNIHPFLMKQRITYRVFIIEQTNGKPFNRASLMNVGYLESLKMYPWDCFIFHDVDLLPLDSRNLYNCPRQPRHLSVAIDTLKFKLPYDTIFGGVSAMTRKHFQAVNGFSNSFFGWGGEDDDMFNRIKRANLFISRYPVNIARYKMLKHQKEKANPKRYETLVNGFSKMEMDGINSIKYDIYSVKEFPTFTWYLIELKIPEITS